MAGVPPKYNSIDWGQEQKYWKPGALADLRRVVHGKKSKARRRLHGAKAQQFNRLSSGGKVDVWKHRDEMSGQR